MKYIEKGLEPESLTGYLANSDQEMFNPFYMTIKDLFGQHMNDNERY